ncbi:MAG: AsmA family protein [Bacteroidales bacterium]|nr:AsmA family protein [Bacteroidales bacterium]
MKKGWKIALISLGSLLGLVVVVVVTVCYLIFTPSRLTSIVNKLADRFVQCEAKFENVDLTLLSTFPNAGLKINNVVIVNPLQGAPSDTVASLHSLTVGVDVKAYLKDKNIIVHQVLLDGVEANLFVDSTGKANYDIFPSSDDDDDDDTSSFKLPDLVDITRVEISDLNAKYNDHSRGIMAGVSDFDLRVNGTLQQEDLDAKLKLSFNVDTLRMTDSMHVEKLSARLDKVGLKLDVDGNMTAAKGHLNLKAPKGKIRLAGTEYIGKTLAESSNDLLELNVPFELAANDKSVVLGNSVLSLDGNDFEISGSVMLPKEERPLTTDVALSAERLQVAPLLSILPHKFTKWSKGMSVDALVGLEATAVGTLSDSTKPLIDAKVELSQGRFYYPKALPYKIDRIKADVIAHLDLSDHGVSNVTINSLKAHTQNTDVSVRGKVKDLTGKMFVDANISGSMPFSDLEPMLPDSLPLDAQCQIGLNLDVAAYLKQLTSVDLEHIKASGNIVLKGLEATYDSIYASSPQLNIALSLPAKEHKNKTASAHITGQNLKVSMPKQGVKADVNTPDINVGVNNVLKEQIRASFVVDMDELEGAYDSLNFSAGGMHLNGSVNLDSTQQNVLRKFNPALDIDLHSVVAYTGKMTDAVRMPQFAFSYSPEVCEIKTLDVRMGMSEFMLYGSVYNLEEWLSHEAMLKGDLNFVSDYADIDQLMDFVSGMGSNPDTLAKQREEDHVAKEANPFIVPKDVNLTLNTHVKRAIAFGNDLSDVAGALTVADGTAVLDQMGFVCKAATMQLTAVYRSPRPNHLFTAIDFHLLDIQIDELLKMIPTVDTLVPMLAAFRGNANFHLAGESYLFANYKPKMSTLLGSAAISGQDLVVFDNENLSQIAKLMQLKSWKEKDNTIHVDSISVEMTCFRKEIEVLPFVVNIGGYSFCASGKHNLDNYGNYHLELLKHPLLARVAVDVNGPLKKPEIKLGSIQYADLYRPERQGVAEAQAMKMKAMVRKALEANVR